MKVIKPDSKDQLPKGISIFLAGSIEMDKAEDWQKKVASKFSKYDITFFNPRRDSWDSSWKQDINDENFNYQVNWEMDHLEISDIILIYFEPNTKSPISLLELGLYADSNKIIICCPDGFWRKGNIQIVSNRYNIPLYDDMDDALYALEHLIYMKNIINN